ncbi:DUF2974 domain-containing protein, partial [Campylobacter sp. MIT 21-1685]|uniref:lipase family protein n=1 Tax=unclassified Campylobacter TaxID=2593542 RepID=UPI00224B57B5
QYAELCWASYSEGLNEGMFKNEERKWGLKNKSEYYTEDDIKALEKNNIELPTYHQALTESSCFIFDKYNVSFDNGQANEFIKRYEVLAFTQDDDTGFSATLFNDTKNDEIILAFRGIDIFRINWNLVNAIKSGVKIFRGKVSINYYLSMLQFYDEKLKSIINNKKIVVTGHVFGGYLAQLFALSFPQYVHKVYTFNAVGITSNEITNYVDKTSEIVNEVTKQIAFDFSIYDSNIDEFRSIVVTDRIKNVISLDNGLLVCDDKTIQNEIPKYLQRDFIITQHNSYNYQTARTGAAKLFNEIHKAPIGHNVFVKVRIDDFLPHTIDTEVFTLNQDLSIAVQNLINYLPNSHKELPQLLQQSEIYRICTIDIMNTETILTQFGNHLHPTETIIIKLNFLKMQTKFDDFQRGRLAKIAFKGLKVSSIANCFVYLISIDNIYKEIIAQSRIKDESFLINCYWCNWENLL